mmetsp:Transcript_110780/g.357561  ORF Transcript_110780/g.357561 Transcript_110780/m.357561 type:complete len:229 (-) Transcript_110780:635-1321(-)
MMRAGVAPGISPGPCPPWPSAHGGTRAALAAPGPAGAAPGLRRWTGADLLRHRRFSCCARAGHGRNSRGVGVLHGAHARGRCRGRCGAGRSCAGRVHTRRGVRGTGLRGGRACGSRDRHRPHQPCSGVCGGGRCSCCCRHGRAFRLLRLLQVPDVRPQAINLPCEGLHLAVEWAVFIAATPSVPAEGCEAPAVGAILPAVIDAMRALITVVQAEDAWRPWLRGRVAPG